jgi:hypothetical protein
MHPDQFIPPFMKRQDHLRHLQQAHGGHLRRCGPGEGPESSGRTWRQRMTTRTSPVDPCASEMKLPKARQAREVGILQCVVSLGVALDDAERRAEQRAVVSPQDAFDRRHRRRRQRAAIAASSRSVVAVAGTVPHCRPA